MESSEDASGQSTPIPIAQINPAFDQLAGSSIRATVTLVWPYSSSTKSFSVLLAEPDVRLRRANGQVKVTFHALVAERIAETHVGIGDEVVLGLAGCRLEENGTATQTPSRYVAWDVHFDDRVHIEISRASQHHATVKIDPPFESQQPAEPANEAPVTPVPSRRRPEDIDTEPAFGAWTSPAFFQRSHASFGGLVDSSVDPFAEEDGFIPGRGRKRPRFSMRSSEWRLVDEPASPGEKASPVDWTEELEAEVDEYEKAAEDIEVPAKSPEPANDLPDTQEGLSGTDFGYGTVSTDQLAPETGPTIDEPVELLAPAPSSDLNGKEEFPNSLQIPIDSPHLRPIPSPGLPVPSPLGASAPENGYFISGPGPAPTSQPITTVTQSQEIIGENGISSVRTETVEVDIEDANSGSAEGFTSFHGNAAPVEPELQTAIETSGQTQTQEGAYFEADAVAPAEDVAPSFPGRESPVEDIPDEDVSDDHSDDVEMVDKDEDEGEDEDEDVDEDDYAEEEMEQEEDPNPVLSVERSPQGSPESGSEEDAAESPLAKAGEPEEVSEDEEEDEDQQGESMDEAGSDEYESEYGYENKREGDLVDSEMESDEDEEETPTEVPTRQPPSNTQPDVIVLDSDDEDDQPAGPQTQQPQPQSERESEGAEQRALSPDEGGDWPSDDENEMGDEPMAERHFDEGDEEDEEEEDGESEPEEPEDKLARNELVEVEADEDESEDEEVDEEEDEEEEYEDDNDYEEDVEDSAAEEQQEKGFSDEQPEHINLLDDDETSEKPDDEHVDNARAEDKEDEDEDDVHIQKQVSEQKVDQQVEDREEDPTSHDQAEAQAEIGTSKDEDKNNDHMEVVDENIQGPEVSAHGQTGKDEQVHGHDNKQEVELVDRTGRVEDQPEEEKPEEKPDEEKPDEDHPDESDADSQDEFVEPLEFLAAPEAPPLVAEPTFNQLGREQQLESNAGLVYDGAASPPGEWYDAPTDVNESGSASPSPSEQQDDEMNGPSQQLAAEHDQQLHALVEAGGTTPAIKITGTPEPEPKQEPESTPRTPSISIKQEEEEEEEEDERENEQSFIGLRSKYSYFAPLASLPDHFNTLTDTISIIHDASSITQAQAGPRDYILTLHLTDPSMAGLTVLAHLTRPYSEALPQHPREGDAILLRNFKPKPFNRAMSLVSDDTSAWAVLPHDNPSEDLVPGPPVEYGVEERSYASELRHWYRHEGGAALVADVSLQASIDYDQDQDQDLDGNTDDHYQDHDLSITSLSPSPSSNASVSGSSDIENLDGQNLGLGLTSGGLVAHRSLLRRAGRRRRRDSRRRGRRITIHELRDGRRYTEVGSPSDRESIHELRDGTVYANL